MWHPGFRASARLPGSPSVNEPDLSALSWSADQLDEAAALLARRSGLGAREATVSAPFAAVADVAVDADLRVRAAVAQLGLEAESVVTPIPRFGEMLLAAGPALVEVGSSSAPRFLAILPARLGRVRLLTPDLQIRSISPRSLQANLCRSEEAPVRAELDALLSEIQIGGGRREQILRAMLDERLGVLSKGGCWLLRMPAEAGFLRQIAFAGLLRTLVGLVVILMAVYGLELLGWRVIGQAALQGRFDTGWFAAWALLVSSALSLELSAHWINARLALDAAALVKRRLLAGVLRHELQAVRSQGLGQLLGRVIETQSIEALAINGGIVALMACVELAFAAWLLLLGMGGALHGTCLLIWLGITAALASRYLAVLRAWTDQRLDLTHDLIERMSGHRTCLAQEPQDRRIKLQDTALEHFHEISKRLDRAALPLTDVLVRGWMVLGVAALAPGLLVSTFSPESAAIGLGGVLLAARAFGRIGQSTGALGRAAVAWDRVRDVFHAGSDSGDAGEPLPMSYSVAGEAAPVMEVRNLSFRHRPGDPPILHGIDLHLNRGDRILLQGNSGGGKSTLAALLLGLRNADSGLVLLCGLDRYTLGRAWRRHIAAVPQFHENHLLAGSLAFNLLMGRRWPATESDLAEAEDVCRSLGLADLIDRMPLGLMQLVGETGWQLSHGEKSRVFLARALLQQAEVTVLDESFAALDPESLKTCLESALARTDTLLVIAHP